VARRRTGNQVLLSTGISAEVAGEPPPYEFMLAIDAEDRQENPLPLIRMTARVGPSGCSISSLTALRRGRVWSGIASQSGSKE
jgi:hypothetical protein